MSEIGGMKETDETSPPSIDEQPNDPHTHDARPPSSRRIHLTTYPNISTNSPCVHPLRFLPRKRAARHRGKVKSFPKVSFLTDFLFPPNLPAHLSPLDECDSLRTTLPSLSTLPPLWVTRLV